MIIKEISEIVYNDFALTHPLLSSYQLVGWGNLKEAYGWKKHLIGFYENNNLKGVTLLLEKKLKIFKSIYYAPRGFLIDFNDLQLLKKITSELKIYLKKNRGIMLKIDPNVVYAFRNSDGEIISKPNDSLVDYLKVLGYKHLGFNKEFETMQPRFLCRYEIIDNDYEKTFNSFSKSTKKNTLKVYENGVCVRKGTSDDINLFCEMENKTAIRKGMVTRPNSYYKKMYESIKDYSEIYLSYIDTQIFLDNILLKIENEKKAHAEIVLKMQKEKVGDNLKNQLDLSNQRSKKLLEEKVLAKDLISKGDKIYIGSLYALYIGEEGITFTSGIDNDYRKFNPKYAMYDEHLKETIRRHKKYVNFYGISGNFDKNSENYKIYELKKGYNPTVVELIGEFDLIISKFLFRLYTTTFSIYKKTKKLKKKS